MGVDRYLDYKQENYWEQLSGVDHVIDTCLLYTSNQDGERFFNEQANAWDLMQAMKANDAQYLIMLSLIHI